MARGNMSDFVAQHAGEFGFRVEVGHNSSRDIDITTRQGEGIDFWRVQYCEGVVEVGAVTFARQILTDAVHIVLQRRIFIDAIAGNDLFMILAPLLDLFGFRNEGKIIFTRYRVGGTGAECQAQYQE